MAQYDEIAADYDRRYALHDYPGIRATLLESASRFERAHVLEVGCGTGKWLAELSSAGCIVAGIDPSVAMLRRASTIVDGDLRAGMAERLPWNDEFFDVVLFVNSLHHVAAPEVAFAEAARVLRPGGSVVSIGLDPHEDRDHWFVYDFFPGTLAHDLARFASAQRRLAWLEAAGFVKGFVRVAEHLCSSLSYAEAVEAGVLAQSFTSQLTALSATDYETGMQRLREAAKADESFRLAADLVLYATQARKP